MTEEDEWNFSMASKCHVLDKFCDKKYVEWEIIVMWQVNTETMITISGMLIFDWESKDF